LKSLKTAWKKIGSFPRLLLRLVLSLIDTHDNAQSMHYPLAIAHGNDDTHAQKMGRILFDLGHSPEHSPFPFDKEKALETLLYVAQKAPVPDRFHICKIIYFADRDHLENFGRFVFGDYYAAMQHGPVPSGAYDLIKAAETGEVEDLKADDLYVMGLRAPRLELFSESDLEALDSAIAEYGTESFDRLSVRSHDDAWKAATDDGRLVEQGGSVPIAFTEITKTMPEGDSVLEYVKEYY
jgi:uncharacterized phage-associated protein